MSLLYIRNYYRVPAKRGAMIKFRGEPWVIVGSDRQYLRARPVDTPPGHYTSTLHPTWEIEYEETADA